MISCVPSSPERKVTKANEHSGNPAIMPRYTSQELYSDNDKKKLYYLVSGKGLRQGLHVNTSKEIRQQWQRANT